jgi:hypothetical protein
MIYLEMWSESESQDIENIRYLTKDLAYMKELREGLIRNSEEEILLSSIIHEENELIDLLFSEVKIAREKRKELERLQRAGSGNIQPRDETQAGSGWEDMGQPKKPENPESQPLLRGI